ncbi:het domain protein [Colletotrichum camelliae]|nr:het domain protein [Colletotrichum camelliae]
MWLINTTTLRLEEILDYSAVEYAILSDTWGDDEVSFKDMQDFTRAKKQAGFVKIATTCELALKEGLDYAWVDTCCIDKTSSAELSEAINAMFVWYRASAVCFVWLEDLAPSSSASKTTPNGKRLHDIAGMASCKWFSRGWTLQELIAPANIRFYDASWNFRFTKENNTSVLATITTIDVEVLKMAKRLKDVLVAVRMSWAANRETTRPEDIAYCLLGIFDINMPMLYGEGEKAFQRLQEHIVNLHGDSSIFAWLAPFRPPLPTQSFRGLFATSPRQFAVVDPEDSEALECFASKSIQIRSEVAILKMGAWPQRAWSWYTWSFCGDALSDDFCGVLLIELVALKPIQLTLVINKLINEEIDLRFFYNTPAHSHWEAVGGSRLADILSYGRMDLDELSKEYKATKPSFLYGRKAIVWLKCTCPPEQENHNVKVEAVANGLEITISLSAWSSGVEEIEEASDHESNEATASQSHDRSLRKRRAALLEPDHERKPRRSKRLEMKKR